MWSRMRPIDVLQIRLEAGIVPLEGAGGEVHVCFREGGVEHQLGVHGRCAGRYGGAVPQHEERLKGITTTDAMWDGVRDRDILETAGSDLEIVCWVTPRPKTLIGTIGKDRRVFKVRGIYFRVRARIIILLVRGMTLCPVPIGLNAGVTAFRPQFVFKGLDVKSVPGEEKSGLMDL